MINAELIKELNAKKNDLNTNFKAEIIAVDLIKRGVDPQRICIIPNGVIGKSSSKDVEVIRIERSIYTLKDYVYVISNRAGIYDTLPEGLFHEQYGYNETDVKGKIKTTRKEEKEARKFFLPFEILINKYKTNIIHSEDVGIYDNIYSIISQFSNNWTIFRSLDQRQSTLFLHVIPILHKIRTNYSLVANFLSLFFDIPFIVTLKQKIITQMVHPEFSLSESRFGLSTVLGGISSEIVPVIHLAIGPIADKNLSSFLPKSKNDILLNELFLWLFDCQTPVEKELIAINNPKQKPSAYYLGTNTFF